MNYYYTHDYMREQITEWRDEAWGHWEETRNIEHHRLWRDLNNAEAQLRRMIEDQAPGVLMAQSD